jgi:hypothetical protein
LVGAGTMHAGERDIAAIAANVAIVSTYWLSYQRLAANARAPGDADAADPSRAAWQVLALIAPYTSGAARALIERLGDRYLGKERR